MTKGVVGSPSDAKYLDSVCRNRSRILHGPPDGERYYLLKLGATQLGVRSLSAQNNTDVHGEVARILSIANVDGGEVWILDDPIVCSSEEVGYSDIFACLGGPKWLCRLLPSFSRTLFRGSLWRIAGRATQEELNVVRSGAKVSYDGRISQLSAVLACRKAKDSLDTRHVLPCGILPGNMGYLNS